MGSKTQGWALKFRRRTKQKDDKLMGRKRDLWWGFVEGVWGKGAKAEREAGPYSFRRATR